MPRKTLPASAVKGATRPAKTDAPVTTGAMRGDAPVQRTVPAKGAPSPFAGAASVFAAATYQGEKAQPRARVQKQKSPSNIVEAATWRGSFV